MMEEKWLCIISVGFERRPNIMELREKTNMIEMCNKYVCEMVVDALNELN